MSQLFRLIFRIRNFLLFVILELVSFWLIVKNNLYWDVSFFNTSNYYAAKTLESSNYVKNYMNLGSVNDQLIAENAQLKKIVVSMQQFKGREGDYYKVDSAFAKRFEFKVAKVVNNTVNLTNNYLTLDKGTLDGIEPGMGVICPQGVVGQVMQCSEHFSRVYSILHANFNVSTEVKNQILRTKNDKALGIAKWGGLNPRVIDLTTIDRFKPIKKGDSVITSEQNVIFPSGTMLGKIRKLSAKQDQAFFDIEVELATDFQNLSYVYIVNNKLKKEQELIEQATTEIKK
ncbi:rod shape-determining protein MreC [Emticicia sp. SJ17W-69]|uniref:rod shape-determining protein MreC n=1 Tax=Emticicia sp. SJ17W-69 TaxID=3421657 RepID=UPI003EBB6D51